MSRPMIFGVAKAIARKHAAMGTAAAVLVDLTDVPMLGVTACLAIENVVWEALDDGWVAYIGAKSTRRTVYSGIRSGASPHVKTTHFSNRGSGMVLEACVFATILLGFLGTLFKRNLIMKVMAMDVMSTGVIAYYVVMAGRGGVLTPIFLRGRTVAAYADPVPQAVILTAIVIGLSIQALMLAGIMRISRHYPTLEVEDMERNNLL